MAIVEEPKEKWSTEVSAVTIGATPAEGGTRGRAITLGGETTVPFIHFEGDTPNRPVVASNCTGAEKACLVLCETP